MIDFSKKIEMKVTVKTADPIEIYNTLDRKSDVGPLRPIQIRILSKWYNERKNDSEVIIKLHTGAGKTLIGLLIAMSYINSGQAPVMYVCPNIYLMQQACSDARKFGVPFCFVGNDNCVPEDFISGKKVLITYVQKVFNGLSIFGIGSRSQSVGCIILDDSHACMEAIAASSTIRINKENDSKIYNRLKDLFEDDLKFQGLGTYLDINNGDTESFMAIPYWSINNKCEEITEILSSNSDQNCIKFAWPIIKNQINNCQMYISSKVIEISPICAPIEVFGVFNKANHRVLMSATTQEDTFFIKGLGMSINSVKNPLLDKEYKWSGEKMILIPQLICENISLDNIKKDLLTIPHKDFGIAVLTPSFNIASEYCKYGGKIANLPGNNMFAEVQEHKKDLNNSIIVFANRYDGIDLPDESCRILFIDSLPYYDLLSDRYEEQCKASSNIVKIKTVQKIEQALGRSVRGEKDYSVIIILGNDLIKYLKSIENTKYFSAETKKQLEIGFEVSSMIKEETSDMNLNVLVSTINQCLSRDEGWKMYYSSSMDEIQLEDSEENDLYKILKNERDAYISYKSGKQDEACNYIQNIINMCEDTDERGWYTQLKAKYMYTSSKLRSNDIQGSAFKLNNELLKPPSGVLYKKLKPLDVKRSEVIKSVLNSFDNYAEFSLELEDILGKFSFGIKANTFEKAVQSIGKFLGFASQRPDKSIGKGPDNLWCDELEKYILIECKSEVLRDRQCIKKTEAGQMLEHCSWFKKEYNSENYYSVMIIPTKVLANDAYFEDDLRIITSVELNRFKNDIRMFFREFKDYDLHTITTEKIASFLISHGLSIDEIINKYTTAAEEDYSK